MTKDDDNQEPPLNSKADRHYFRSAERCQLLQSIIAGALEASEPDLFDVYVSQVQFALDWLTQQRLLSALPCLCLMWSVAV